MGNVYPIQDFKLQLKFRTEPFRRGQSGFEIINLSRPEIGLHIKV